MHFLLGVGIGADYPTGAAYVAEFLMPIVRQQRGLTATVLSVAALTLIGLLTTVLLRGELKHDELTPEA